MDRGHGKRVRDRRLRGSTHVLSKTQTTKGGERGEKVRKASRAVTRTIKAE